MRLFTVLTIFISCVTCSTRPTPQEIAGYHNYSKILATAARPVARSVSGNFGRFISTIAKLGPIALGAAGGSFVGGALGSVFLLRLFIGPVVGTVAGTAIGRLSNGVTQAAASLTHHGLKKVSNVFLPDAMTEFGLAKRGLAKLHAALSKANKNKKLMSAVDKVEKYLTDLRYENQDEYKESLKTIYAPAAANFKLFWQTEEKVCTVLGGATSFADLTNQVGTKLAGLSLPGVKQAISFGTFILSSSMSAGATVLDAVTKNKKEANNLTGYLQTARSKLADLESRDVLIRSFYSNLSRKMGIAAHSFGKVIFG